MQRRPENVWAWDFLLFDKTDCRDPVVFPHKTSGKAENGTRNIVRATMRVNYPGRMCRSGKVEGMVKLRLDANGSSRYIWISEYDT